MVGDPRQYAEPPSEHSVFLGSVRRLDPPDGMGDVDYFHRCWDVACFTSHIFQFEAAARKDLATICSHPSIDSDSFSVARSGGCTQDYWIPLFTMTMPNPCAAAPDGSGVRITGDERRLAVQIVSGVARKFYRREQADRRTWQLHSARDHWLHLRLRRVR